MTGRRRPERGDKVGPKLRQREGKRWICLSTELPRLAAGCKGGDGGGVQGRRRSGGLVFGRRGRVARPVPGRGSMRVKF